MKKSITIQSTLQSVLTPEEDALATPPSRPRFICPRDLTCQLGTPQYRSVKRHRVVIFRDFEGREIRVVTDLMGVTAEQIVLMYKYVGK